MRELSGLQFGRALQARKSSKILHITQGMKSERRRSKTLLKQNKMPVTIDNSTTTNGERVHAVFSRNAVGESRDPQSSILAKYGVLLMQKSFGLLNFPQKYGFSVNLKNLAKRKPEIICIWWCINTVKAKVTSQNDFLTIFLRPLFGTVPVTGFNLVRVMLKMQVHDMHVHLHTFCDKLYSLHHESPKNQDELSTCAESLHCDLLRTGRAFGTKWVALSYRTVEEVQRSYIALWKYQNLQHSSQMWGSTAGHFVGVIRTFAHLQNRKCKLHKLHTETTLSENYSVSRNRLGNVIVTRRGLVQYLS